MVTKSALYGAIPLPNIDVPKHTNLILKLIFTRFGREQKIGELTVLGRVPLAPSQVIKWQKKVGWELP